MGYGWSLLGFFLGGFIGFLLRPATWSDQQLPFLDVITRGSGLTGVNAMWVSLAERSFNFTLAGAIIGTCISLLIGYLIHKQKEP